MKIEVTSCNCNVNIQITSSSPKLLLKTKFHQNALYKTKHEMKKLKYHQKIPSIDQLTPNNVYISPPLTSNESEIEK